MSLLIVQRHPRGPRVFVLGQRVHHGATGCALALAAIRAHRLRRLALLAAAASLTAHDRRDWKIWFARESAGMSLDSREKFV